jgi:hypothetical protein
MPCPYRARRWVGGVAGYGQDADTDPCQTSCWIDSHGASTVDDLGRFLYSLRTSSALQIWEIL